MEEEFKSGLMVQDMRVTGKITEHVVKEDLYMQMVIYMKENG